MIVFPYTQFGSKERVQYRPTVPVIFRHGKTRIPIAHAIVDTGADYTLLPLQLANEFGFTFDLKKGELWNGAGGGTFRVYRAPEAIDCVIQKNGFAPLQWKSIVHFTLEQPTILLGHRGCLEYFNLSFYGKKKELHMDYAK